MTLRETVSKAAAELLNTPGTAEPPEELIPLIQMQAGAVLISLLNGVEPIPVLSGMWWAGFSIGRQTERILRETETLERIAQGGE